MGRGKHATPELRRLVLKQRQKGYSFYKIAENLSMSYTSVRNAVVRWNQSGSLKDRPKSGRPKKSSEKEDRIIHRMSERDRKRTAVDIHSTMKDKYGSKISVHTVRRRLVMFGLHGRAPRSKPDVSKKEQSRQTEVCQ